MHYLAIDIGNTRVKWGHFEGDRLVKHWAGQKEDFAGSLIDLPLASQQWAVGWISVGDRNWEVDKLKLWENYPATIHFHPIDHTSSLPIDNKYLTPQTLGLDRIVGVIAAQAICPKTPVLVIDAGTAITYDIADRTGSYLGGGIGPGMHMRFQALHHFTARLPLISPTETPPEIGRSTEESIQVGVMQGMAAEIEGMVRRYKQQLGTDLQVFLTGGDLYRFENQVECYNFADSNLIIKGIHRILSHIYAA